MTMIILKEILFVLIILPGMALAYTGFSVHRRHVQLAGFVIGFLSIGLLATLLVDSSLLVLAIAGIGGLGGAKTALAAEKGIVVLAGFLVGAFISSLILQQATTDPIPLLIGLAGAIAAWRAHVLFILVYTAGLGTMWMYIVAAFTSDYDPIFLISVADHLWLPVLWVFISAISLQATLIEEGYLPDTEAYVSGKTKDSDKLDQLFSDPFSDISRDPSDWKETIRNLPSERPLTAVFLGSAALGFLITFSLFAALLIGIVGLAMIGSVVALVNEDEVWDGTLDDAASLQVTVATIILGNLPVIYLTPYIASLESLLYGIGAILGIYLTVGIFAIFVFDYMVQEHRDKARAGRPSR